MSTNYLINVPKLKGRENYNEWTFAAENFLILEDMVHCIKPVRDKVVEAADDARTKAKLIMTIDSTLYVHVKDVKTSLELWNTLKALFDDAGFTRRISLLRHLISIRLENCVNMQEYITQIIETGQKLNGTGFKITDEWIGCLLLAGLTETFRPMIMAIEHSGIVITTDAIRTKLMDMETETSVARNGINDVNGAFATSSGNKKWQHRNKSTTSVSKQKCHSQERNTKAVKCYRCKQVGHYKNQCTNNESNSANKKNKERMQSNAFSTVFLSANFNKNDWYIDSGASVHLTANESWVMNARYKQNKEIVVANNEKMTVLCSGNVKITTSTDDCEYDIVIEDVCCIPSLTTNLLSVSQLIKKGNSVSFTDTGCCVYNKKQQLVATAILVNGVYKVNLVSQEYLAASAVSGITWHRRLGHVNKEYLNKMKNAVLGMSFDEKVEISKASCTTCCEGKQCRLPFKGSGQRSSNLLDLVHTDICGPMETTSIGGARYFLLFVDDFSRMTAIYFLRSKNDALRSFKEYKVLVENQTNKKIKIIRSDNGREFCNAEFNDYLKKMGIVHQTTCPYTPEQNGLCERMNRTLVEKARCMLFDAQLSKIFWAEATNTAVYLHNRTGLSVLQGKTPYELWHGVKPDISHLRIFGSKVMVHIPKEKRKKWDRKSVEHILVGYPDNCKGYRIYNPNTKCVTTSRDVIIMEDEKNNFEVSLPVSEDQNSSSVGDINSEEITSQVPTDEDTLVEVLDTSDDTYVPSEYEDSSSSPEQRVRPRRTIKRPERYGISNMCISQEIFDDASDLSLEEALKGGEKKQWSEAVKEELSCFQENNAWSLVDMPSKGETIVKCKWVLRKKLDNNSNVRYRARLVAKGYMQKQNVDYSDIFSPVVRHSTLRLMFALSVKLGLDVMHLDVKTAFLNGDLEETIYMEIPEGLPISENNKNKVLKLNRAIYGLKQSSRAWYRKVDECLISSGYKRSKLEPCLYIKNNGNLKTFVTLYVDDFFVFTNDNVEFDCLKRMLTSKFQIKDLGQVKNCLGMNVNINKVNGSVTLSQENYIDQLLKRFNMTNCKTVDTPVEPKLTVNLDNKNCDSQIPYQQLIGGLMYLAVLTRPDIAYSVPYNSTSHGQSALSRRRTYAVLHFAHNFSSALGARVRDGDVPDDILRDSIVSVWLDTADYQISNFIKMQLHKAYEQFTRRAMAACGLNEDLVQIPVHFEEPVYGSMEAQMVGFMAPGIMITIIFFLPAIVTSTLMISDRLEGVWERSAVAGVRAREMLNVHCALQSVVILMQTLEMMALAYWGYSLPSRGSLLTCGALLFLQGLSGMCYGFLLSVLCSSYTVSFFVATGSFYPMILLCGILWPLEGMSAGLRAVALALPFTVPSKSLRDIMEKGSSITDAAVYNGFLITIAWIVVTISLCFLRLKYKKT